MKGGGGGGKKEREEKEKQKEKEQTKVLFFSLPWFLLINSRRCLLRAFAVEDIFSGLHLLIFLCSPDASLKDKDAGTKTSTEEATAWTCDGSVGM